MVDESLSSSRDVKRYEGEEKKHSHCIHSFSSSLVVVGGGGVDYLYGERGCNDCAKFTHSLQGPSSPPPDNYFLGVLESNETLLIPSCSSSLPPGSHLVPRCLCIYGLVQKSLATTTMIYSTDTLLTIHPSLQGESRSTFIPVVPLSPSARPSEVLLLLHIHGGRASFLHFFLKGILKSGGLLCWPPAPSCCCCLRIPDGLAHSHSLGPKSECQTREREREENIYEADG